MEEDDPFHDSSLEPRTPRSAVIVAPLHLGKSLPLWFAVFGSIALTSGLLGFTAYQTLTGLGLSQEGLARTSFWSWMMLPAAIASFVVAVLCIVVFARAGVHRMVAVIALLTSLSLPLVAGYVGLRVGFEQAVMNVGGDISHLAAQIDLAPILEWLLSLVGGV